MLCWKIGNRTSRELLKEFARTISKSSSSSNSEAVVRKKDRFGEESVPNVGKHVHVKDKWSQISRQNNIRALSTIQTKVKPQANNAFFSKEESREFMAVFPDIVRDLTDAGRHTDIPEVTKRFVKVLQYNVPTGKKTRGLSTVVAYKMLEKQENLTPENVRLANVLGWCVELLRGFGLVIDDFIDNSEMRRQLPCWYRKEGVGTLAVMDATLLEHSVYTILRKHFSHLPSYVPLVEVFRDASAKNALGKSLDGVITNGGSPVLDKFTMKNYNLIMKYRTGYYSFQLPLASAMYLANLYDKEQHRQAKTIILEMGEFFQIQKDFLNVFGSPELTKVGSDIEEGKCSWLAVVALQRANPAQRKILEDNYGKPGQESVDVVKDLYVKLGLPATFSKYSDETYKLINTHIQQISKGLPHKLFLTLLDKLYQFE